MTGTPPILRCCVRCGEDRAVVAFRQYRNREKDGTVKVRRRRECVWCERDAANARYRRRVMRDMPEPEPTEPEPPEEWRVELRRLEEDFGWWNAMAKNQRGRINQEAGL